ncbi:hypothetical protein DW036_18220 [Bacteroides sp. AF39-11AC]|jgi:hypothetical protein|nr:hypothetical protein DW036_18220 [Bacteroides sp. AF39-11AC]
MTRCKMLLLFSFFILLLIINVCLAFVVGIILIANLYVRNRYMRRRFNPWHDKRRNFETIVIGDKYNVNRLCISIDKTLEETIWGRSLYASFHILRTYFSLLKNDGKVYIVYREKYLEDFSPIDMSIVYHPVTLSIIGCKYWFIERKFPIFFMLLYWCKRVFRIFTAPKRDIEASLISQIKLFCEERQIQVEFIKI